MTNNYRFYFQDDTDLSERPVDVTAEVNKMQKQNIPMDKIKKRFSVTTSRVARLLTNKKNKKT